MVTFSPSGCPLLLTLLAVLLCLTTAAEAVSQISCNGTTLTETTASGVINATFPEVFGLPAECEMHIVPAVPGQAFYFTVNTTAAVPRQYVDQLWFFNTTDVSKQPMWREYDGLLSSTFAFLGSEAHIFMSSTMPDDSVGDEGFLIEWSTTPPATCGDGIRQEYEACDAATNDGSLGCEAQCLQLAPGFACNATVGALTECEATCGNGERDAFEECDDGDSSDTFDGCSPNCLYDRFYCPYPGETLTLEAKYGAFYMEGYADGDVCDFLIETPPGGDGLLIGSLWPYFYRRNMRSGDHVKLFPGGVVSPYPAPAGGAIVLSETSVLVRLIGNTYYRTWNSNFETVGGVAMEWAYKPVANHVFSFPPDNMFTENQVMDAQLPRVTFVDADGARVTMGADSRMSNYFHMGSIRPEHPSLQHRGDHSFTVVDGAGYALRTRLIPDGEFNFYLSYTSAWGYTFFWDSMDTITVAPGAVVARLDPLAEAYAGETMAAFTVSILDDDGDVITVGPDAGLDVAISLLTNQTMSGTMTATAVLGVATFSDIAIAESSRDTFLAVNATASNGNVVTSATPIEVWEPAAHLEIVDSGIVGVDKVAGTQFTVTVNILDAGFNLVTYGGDSSLSVNLNINQGFYIGGTSTLTETAVEGVATFQVTIADVLAGYQFDAAAVSGSAGSPGVTGILGTFDVIAAAFFVYHPGPMPDYVVGQPYVPTYSVSIMDLARQVIPAGPDSVLPVTLKLNKLTFANTGSDLYTVPAVNGVAEFPALTFATAADSYTITVSATNAASMPLGNVTNMFTVGPAAASIALDFSMTGVVEGFPLDTAPVVRVLDSIGGPVTTGPDSVILFALTVNQNTFTGSTSRTSVAGTATWNDVVFSTVDTGYTLTVTGTAVTGLVLNETTHTFEVSQRAASIVLVSLLSPSISHVPFFVSPVYEIRDSGGAPVLSGPDSVLDVEIEINFGDGTLVGTTTVQSVAGVASFPDVGIATDGGNFDVRAFTHSSAANMLIVSTISPQFFVQQMNVTSVTPDNGPTGGTYSLVLLGGPFGAPTSTVALQTNDGPVKTCTRQSATQVTCEAPPGTGSETEVRVVIDGGVTGPFADYLFSYDAPAVPTWTASGEHLTSGVTLTLSGTNLHPLETNITIGGEMCTNVAGSYTTLTCLTPAGTGTGKAISVSVGPDTERARVVAPVATFDYAAPRIVSIVPPPAVGGTLQILGHNFGASAATLNSLTVRGAPCTSVTVVSHQRIDCVMPAGTGGNGTIAMTVGGQALSPAAPTAFSYAAPVVSSGSRISHNGGPVTLTGVNFGNTQPPSLEIIFDGQTCASPIWASDASVRCTAPEADDRSSPDATVRIAVNGIWSALKTVTGFYYPTPIVQMSSSLSVLDVAVPYSIEEVVATVDWDASDAPQTLALTVTRSSGSTQPMPVFSLTPPEASVEAEIVMVIGTSSDVIGSSVYTLTLRYPNGAVASVTQYAVNKMAPIPPTFSSIVPSNGPMEGGQTVTVNGNNFGIFQSSLVRATIGNVSVASMTFVSSTRLLLRTSPVSTPGPAYVSVETTLSAGSAFGLYSFNALPRVLAVQPTSSLANRRDRITVFGERIGADSTATVTVAGVPCTSVSAVNTTELVCTLEDANTDVSGTVSVRTPRFGSSSLSSATFAFTATQATAITPTRGPSSGGAEVLIEGVRFSGALTNVSIGGVSCLNPRSNGTGRVLCTTGDFGPTRSGPACVHVGTITGGQSSACAATYTVLEPSTTIINSVAPLESALGGRVDVTISGMGFGLGIEDVTTLTVAGQDCLGDFRLLGETIIVCTIPSVDAAVSGPVVVGTRFGGTAQSSAIFSYTASALPTPVVYSVLPSSGAMSGGATLLISGRNFGETPGDLVSVSIGGVPCEISYGTGWIDSNTVRCVTGPSPMPGAMPIVLTTTLGQTTSSVLFTYSLAAPILTQAFPRVGSRDGGDAVTILGTGFRATGSTSGTVVISMNGVPCAESVVIDSTTAICTTVPSDMLPEGTSVVLFTLLELTSGLSSQPVDLGFKYVAANLICSPSCGLNAECVNGECVCNNGWLNPPGCGQFALATSITANTSSEDGVRASFTLSVRTAPTSDVTATFTVSDASEAVLLTPQLIFTPNGALTRKVTLTGVRDDVRDGLIGYKVNGKAASLDRRYDGLIMPPVSLFNQDSAPVLNPVVTPSLSPLNGTNMTVTGQNFDFRFTVYVGDRRAPAVTPILAAATTSGGTRELSGGDEHLRQSTSSQRVVGFIVRTPSVPSDGYYSMRVVNSGGSERTVDGFIYYSDDCPEEGFFGRGSNCKPCPKGGFCPGGDRVWALPGYWNPGEDSGIVIPCEPAERCLGTVDSNGLGSGCAPEYTGDLCGECVDGFYDSGGECVACPAVEGFLLTLVANIAVWMLIAIAAWFLEDRENLSHVIQFVLAVQMIGGVGQLISNRLPRWLRSLYEVFYIVSGDIQFLKPDCQGNIDFVTDYFLSIVFNLAVGLPMVLGTIVVGKLVLFYRYNGAPEDIVEERKAHFFNRFVRTILIHATILYMTVTARSLAGLACRRTDDGKIRLMVSVTQECFADGHSVVFVFSLLFLMCMTIGFPVWYFLFLRKNKPRLVLDIDFMERYDFLYDPFRKSWKHSWIGEFLIGLVLGISDTFLGDSSIGQFVLSGGTFFTFAMISFILRPFRRGWENITMGIAFLANFLALLVVMLTDQIDPESTVIRVLIYIIVIMVASVLLVMSLIVLHFVFLVKSTIKARDDIQWRTTTTTTTTSDSSWTMGSEHDFSRVIYLDAADAADIELADADASAGRSASMMRFGGRGSTGGRRVGGGGKDDVESASFRRPALVVRGISREFGPEPPAEIRVAQILSAISDNHESAAPANPAAVQRSPSNSSLKRSPSASSMKRSPSASSMKRSPSASSMKRSPSNQSVKRSGSAQSIKRSGSNSSMRSDASDRSRAPLKRSSSNTLQPPASASRRSSNSSNGSSNSGRKSSRSPAPPSKRRY